jgi:hypothetical protein
VKQKLRAVLILFLLHCSWSFGQGVAFELKSNPSVDFTFNTIEKYTKGITIRDAVILDVVANGTQWDMYVGSVTSAAGTWDNVQYYSATGDGAPPVGLLQVQFRNSSSTPLITGFVPMQDLSTSTLDIIGNHNSAPDPPVNCADASHKGTNTAGTYVTDPQCYRFKVDFRIVPGLSYRAGLYNAEVDIIIARDL